MKHVLQGNVFCALCGSHKGCQACKIQTPTCPDSEDGKHVWQKVQIKAL